MALEVREFNRQSDYPSYRELFDLSFPETTGMPVSTDLHYRWKFDSFPASPPSYEFAALDDGKLVGYYAALPYPYTIGTKSVRCGMVCDVMTHPEMRGKGVFAKIGTYATESLGRMSVGFTSGYPIRPEVIPGHLKAGWSIAFREPVYVRPLRANGLLGGRRGISRLAPILNSGLAMVNRLVDARLGNGYDTELLTREQFLGDDGYATFFTEWATEWNNHLQKDKVFLAWRTGAPGTTYRFIKLSIGGRWAGLAIARPTILKGVPALAVLDIMVLRKHTRGLRRLHHSLAQVAHADSCGVVATMMSPCCAAAYRLSRNFYLRTPAVFSVIFKPLAPGLTRERLGGVRDWHLTWIDSDDL